jgi:protein ImuA
MSSLRSETLQHLAQRIREIESSCHPPDRSSFSLGIPALDDLLPERRLPAGSLVELLAATEGAGVWTLALLMARHACGERKVLVVADVQGCFYPPAASKLGVDWGRSMVIRPTSQRDTYLAIHQSLRCAAVGAVIGWCDHLRMVDFLRLQQAAVTGGGLGLLLRPAGALRIPSCAAVRWRVAPIVSADAPRRIQIQVVRCRGGKTGQSLILEIDDETGHVRVPAGVVPPAALARSTRASG